MITSIFPPGRGWPWTMPPTAPRSKKLEYGDQAPAPVLLDGPRPPRQSEVPTRTALPMARAIGQHGWRAKAVYSRTTAGATLSLRAEHPGNGARFVAVYEGGSWAEGWGWYPGAIPRRIPLAREAAWWVEHAGTRRVTVEEAAEATRPVVDPDAPPKPKRTRKPKEKVNHG